MRFLLSFTLLLLAAKAVAQPVPVKIRPLNYFYIDKSISLKSGVNYFVIDDSRLFRKMFGDKRQADTPNFSKEVVLVMLMPASNKESELKFERVMMKAGDFVEVYCTQNLNHHKLPYTQNAIAVTALEKFPGIHRIIFYEEKKMRHLETVELKD